MYTKETLKSPSDLYLKEMAHTHTLAKVHRLLHVDIQYL